MAYGYDRLYAQFPGTSGTEDQRCQQAYEIGWFGTELELRAHLSAEQQELAVRKLKEAEFHR